MSRPELIHDGSDREFRELVHNLLGFLVRHERIRDGHARTIGLAGIEYTALISIAHLAAGGDVNVKTVAEHLHLSGAFITSTVRRLEQRGLVKKTVDPLDRRRVALTVSERGLAALNELAPLQRKVNDAEFACLGRKEFKELNAIMKQLIQCGDQAVALQNYLIARGGPAERSDA